MKARLHVSLIVCERLSWSPRRQWCLPAHRATRGQCLMR